MKFKLLFTFLLIAFITESQEDTLRFKEIDAVRITQKTGKHVAFEDDQYYIVDFHIGEKGNFLLLRKFRKYFIYSLNSQMEVTDTLELNFNPNSLYYDCLGFLHIMSKDSLYQLEKVNDQLLIYESNHISLYDNFLKNCVAINNDAVIFKRLENHNQSTVYFGIRQVDQTHLDYYRIEDSLLINSAADTKEVIRQENYNNHRRMGDINIQQLIILKDQQERKQFFEQIVTNPDYHPLFQVGDTTFIFDHLNGQLVSLNDSGRVVALQPIDHHKSNTWEKKIYFDQGEQDFYTVEQKNGAQIFGRFSTKNGKTSRKTKVTDHVYPKKIIVYKGFVYYTYKEHFDDNLNKLYKQRI